MFRSVQQSREHGQKVHKQRGCREIQKVNKRQKAETAKKQ